MAVLETGSVGASHYWLFLRDSQGGPSHLALRLRRPPRCLEHELVVQPQLQLRHTAQERLHLDSPHDLGVEDGAVRADQEVELLNDVEKDLEPSEARCGIRDYIDGVKNQCYQLKN